MKKSISSLRKKPKLIVGSVISVISALALGLGLGFGLDRKKITDFETEKGHLWNIISETPKDTAHVVFINGFVGTSVVTKYLDEVAKNNFSVSVVRGYMSSGKDKNETDKFKKYGNLEFYEASAKSTHMKSYFWFNNKKELIRSITGSGNFSESAIFKVPSYKEVLYDVSDYQGVGRDLFCGGTDASKIKPKLKTEKIPEKMQNLYDHNCKGFDLEDKTTHQSKELIFEKKQFKNIVEAHKSRQDLKNKAKGLIILTGDGETEVMKNYLETTKEEKINLDVFVGNTAAGFKPEEEVKLLEQHKNRFNIIREHPKLTKGKDDKGLIKSSTAKTHTKLYVWYDEKYNILEFWSGSANFSNNGVDFMQKNISFREVLINMKLEKNWKNELVCKVITAFKTKPTDRINKFCAAQTNNEQK